jgi:RNA polymerase sigma-70 factor (ECF subfamily)
MDERQLIDRCIRGEAGAWELLVHEHGPSVYEAARFTLRRVLGSAQAEDIENVYQGVLLGLCDRDFHRLKLFQNRSSFRTWLTSVTVRFALNFVRAEKRKGSLKYLALDSGASEIPDREFFPEEADERERIHRALERIPPREKLILKLLFFDGLSYRSIAEVMKIPVNSVSPLLIRAKDSLRKQAEIR